MHPTQLAGHRNAQHRFVGNGLRTARHDDRWPDPPWLPPRGFLGNGTLLVETGGIDTILACCATLKSPWRFFIRKGILWMLIAMVAGVLPVVSLAIFFASSFIVSLLLQVVHHLNLNGIFLSLLYREERLLGMFFSTYQIRSSRYVLDFYQWATAACF
jgi:hypothetical protein